jgi:hypothetical protein
LIDINMPTVVLRYLGPQDSTSASGAGSVISQIHLALAAPFTVAALATSVGLGVLSGLAAVPLQTARSATAVPKPRRT